MKKPVFGCIRWLTILAVVSAVVMFGNGTTSAERQPITIKFVHGAKQIEVNGARKTLSQPLPVKNGVTMVPVSTLASALRAKLYTTGDGGVHLDTYFTKVTVYPGNRGSKLNGNYVLLDSPVLKLNGSTHLPLSAIPKFWKGSYRFDPNRKEVSVEIPPEPNVRPVADFYVKEVVKRGEPLQYEVYSYDPDGTIVKEEWIGRKSAFFEAGTYEISHLVYDNDGEASEIITRIVKVTDEVMYAPYEYYMRFGNPGDKFPISNSSLFDYREVETKESYGGRTLYLSNGPELILENGVLYKDMLIGQNRLFLHHRNGSEVRKKVGIVATNMESYPIELVIGNRGVAGPSSKALQFGYAAVYRYLQPAESRVLRLEPGESELLVPELNRLVMNPQDGMSALIDLDTKDPVMITAIAVDEYDDPAAMAHALPVLDRVGNRGTFKHADRTVIVDELIGASPKRLRLGNKGALIKGVDATTGQETANGGEYASFTTIQLNNVAYGTRIILNPRAGTFAGAVEVNGRIVSVPNGGYVAPQEAVLIYTQQHPQEGEEEQDPPAVTIKYTSPGASSLPVDLVFVPENMIRE